MRVITIQGDKSFTEVCVVCWCECRGFRLCPGLVAPWCGGKDTGPGVAAVKGQLHLLTAVCAGMTHESLGAPLLRNRVTDPHRAGAGLAFVKAGESLPSACSTVNSEPTLFVSTFFAPEMESVTT